MLCVPVRWLRRCGLLGGCGPRALFLSIYLPPRLVLGVVVVCDVTINMMPLHVVPQGWMLGSLSRRSDLSFLRPPRVVVFHPRIAHVLMLIKLL